jgi:hypothetical protein
MIYQGPENYSICELDFTGKFVYNSSNARHTVTDKKGLKQGYENSGRNVELNEDLKKRAAETSSIGINTLHGVSRSRTQTSETTTKY